MPKNKPKVFNLSPGDTKLVITNYTLHPSLYNKDSNFLRFDIYYFNNIVSKTHIFTFRGCVAYRNYLNAVVWRFPWLRAARGGTKYACTQVNAPLYKEIQDFIELKYGHVLKRTKRIARGKFASPDAAIEAYLKETEIERDK